MKGCNSVMWSQQGEGEGVGCLDVGVPKLSKVRLDGAARTGPLRVHYQKLIRLYTAHIGGSIERQKKSGPAPFPKTEHWQVGPIIPLCRINGNGEIGIGFTGYEIMKKLRWKQITSRFIIKLFLLIWLKMWNVINFLKVAIPITWVCVLALLSPP